MIGNIGFDVDENDFPCLAFQPKADSGLRTGMAGTNDNASVVHRTSGNFRAS
jgi:hypothetical protein